MHLDVGGRVDLLRHCPISSLSPGSDHRQIANAVRGGIGWKQSVACPRSKPQIHCLRGMESVKEHAYLPVRAWSFEGNASAQFLVHFTAGRVRPAENLRSSSLDANGGWGGTGFWSWGLVLQRWYGGKVGWRDSVRKCIIDDDVQCGNGERGVDLRFWVLGVVG